MYVQHLLGSGHLHRTARIACELAQDGMPVVLCSGGVPVSTLPLTAGVRFVQLAPLRCAPGDFTTLLDTAGRPPDDELRARRREQLFSALRAAEPQLALIESFPFARRQMRFEVLPLLDRLQAARIATVCSIRDILQIKTKPERELETLSLLARYFSAVLVHGDPRVAILRDTFSRADAIACPVHYTGYVAAPPAQSAPPADQARADIVVSAGGGDVGYPLIRTALHACRAGCQPDRRWRFLLGGGLEAQVGETLRAAAPGHARITPVSRNFGQLLQHCDLSISQAGYNTVVDVLQAGCRGLLVPYAQDGEMEQTMRAERLQVLGLVACGSVEPNAAELGALIDQALAQPLPRGLRADLDGARNSVTLLRTLLGNEA